MNIKLYKNVNGIPSYAAPNTGNVRQTEGGGTCGYVSKLVPVLLVLQDPTLNIKTEAGL